MLLTDIRTPIHDHLGAIEKWLGDITTLEWVLLAVACCAFLWVVATVRAATHLGPIEIAKLEQDGTNVDLLLARTSRLRERISDVGLRPPPEVPSGAPSADLLSAIEKSPIPEANWIASLIKAVPRPQPVSYKLSTTLLSDPSGVRIWLRPVGPGNALLTSVFAGIDPALDRIPELLLIHISQDAVNIFPGWARWDDPAALRQYLQGLRAADERRYEDALQEFASAAKLQPDNALVPLRRLNIRESRASRRAADAQRQQNAVEDVWNQIKIAGAMTPLLAVVVILAAALTLAEQAAAAQEQAQVLREYLNLAAARPELVEARYRASTLASMVAGGFSTLPSDAAKQNVVTALGRSGQPLDDLVPWLRRRAKRELKQALLLLEPWSVALIWHRPRYIVESRGYARRRLKRTLEISKRCQLARTLADSTRFQTRLRLFSADTFVRLNASRATADWQADYNAGCYFALRNNTGSAYRYLNRALDGGGERRLMEWLEDGDPDLNALRTTSDPRWMQLTRRSDLTSDRRPRVLTRELVGGAGVLAVLLIALAVVTELITYPLAWEVSMGLFALSNAWWRFGRYLTKA